MRGMVRWINRQRGFVAVQTPEREFTVFELLGDYEIEPGDFVEGNLEALGGETLHNVTRSTLMEVYVQDIHATRERAEKMLWS